MKKFILLISLLIPFIVGATDNTRSKSGKLALDGWYDIDRCTAADTITPNKDSTIWYWEVTKSDGYEVIFIVDADSISGMDTTLTWQILGCNNLSLGWTAISNGTIAAFNDTIVELKSHSSNTFAITQASSTIASHTVAVPADTLFADTTGLANYPADTITTKARNLTVAQQTITNGTQTFTSTSCTYRFIALRLSLVGLDDATGSGYLVNNVEILIRRRGL